MNDKREKPKTKESRAMQIYSAVPTKKKYMQRRNEIEQVMNFRGKKQQANTRPLPVWQLASSIPRSPNQRFPNPTKQSSKPITLFFSPLRNVDLLNLALRHKQALHHLAITTSAPRDPQPHPHPHPQPKYCNWNQ